MGSIPTNPEAQLFCGKLSAKLAIIGYDKKRFIKQKKKKSLDDETKSIVVDENVENTKKLKAKQNKKTIKRKKSRKVSLADLNERIAANKVTADVKVDLDTVLQVTSEPPKKRRKKNKKSKKVKKAVVT